MSDKDFQHDEPLNEEPTDQPHDNETVDAIDPWVELEAERDELKAQLQRTAADYQNYIRRSQQESARSVELARGNVAGLFIPVVDHFDNALAKEPQSDEARALYQGMQIVRNELLRALSQLGVERIEVQPGEPFDPSIHEAMMRQPAEGVEPNCVSLFMQPGYKHGSRTLRPAKVAVAPEADANNE